jgi:hypothetical protein
LKEVQDLESRISGDRLRGKMPERLRQIENELKRRSAAQDAPYLQMQAQQQQRIEAEKQRDEAVMTDTRRKYAMLCADYRFDDARAAVDAAVVTGSQGLQEKTTLLKKADWLRQFKALLIQDINLHGYPNPVVNRSGGRLPDGTRQANDAALLVQTQFGVVPFAWNTIPPATLLAMANSFSQAAAGASPQQAADREWLSGVFACEEGMPRDGHTLLVQASQVKDEYKGELTVFLENE